MNHNIAIIGLPASGKTAFLTRLICHQKYESCSSLSSAFIERNKRILEKGNWEQWEATDSLQKTEVLKWEITRDDGKKFILKFKDFAGETWKKFIDQYQDNGELARDVKQQNEIESFIKNSVAVVICYDLEAIWENPDDNQKWMVTAVKRCLGDSADVELGLVVTKWDAVKDRVNQEGGLASVLKKNLGDRIVEYFNGRIFPVSVAEFEFNSTRKIYVPIRNSAATGFNAVDKWLFCRMDITEGKIIAFIVVMIAVGGLLAILFKWGYELFATSLFQWGILIVLIAVLIYSIYLIKNLLKKGL